MNSLITSSPKLISNITQNASFLVYRNISSSTSTRIINNSNINFNNSKFNYNNNKINNNEFLSVLKSSSKLNNNNSNNILNFENSKIINKRFLSTINNNQNNNNQNNQNNNGNKNQKDEQDVIISIKPVHNTEKVSWKTKIKQGIDHYWLGTKLLGKNISIALSLIKRVIKGHVLSRRERRLLIQTSADVMRIVPFVIIVLVPFLELALPFLLKLFPNLLPSTYTWESERLEGVSNRSNNNSKVRGEIKELFHEISAESKKNTKSNEFYDFINKIRSGQTVSSEEVIKFSQYFKDDIVMEKITRSQLLTMHRYLAGANFISKWYSNEYLKSQIYKKLDKIKQDDILIKKEGLHSLTLEELVDAAITRGFKVEGYNRRFIEGQLDQWLDLSLNKSLPPSLLILSRAFTLSPSTPTDEALEDTLEHIPKELLKGVASDLPVDLSTETGIEIAKEKIEELNKEQKEVEEEIKKEEEEIKKEEEEKKQQIDQQKSLESQDQNQTTTEKSSTEQSSTEQSSTEQPSTEQPSSSTEQVKDTATSNEEPKQK